MVISPILVACNSQMDACFGGYCHEGLEVIVMKMIRRIFIIYCIVLSIALLFKFNLSVNSIMEKINSVRWSRAKSFQDYTNYCYKKSFWKHSYFCSIWHFTSDGV